jgi:ubiquitin-activating enzyme E1
VKPVQSANSYLSEPNYVETTLKHGGSQTEQLLQIREYLVNSKPLTFEECITWARFKFEFFYNNEIQQLLYSLPADAVGSSVLCAVILYTHALCAQVTSTGQPFWSGPKRAPSPLKFDPENVGNEQPNRTLHALTMCSSNLEHSPRLHHFRG